MIKRPKRLVLLGRSLGHSLSPIFQNAALQQAQLPLRYETLDIPASAIDGTLEELSAQDAAGNVTVPYKQDVFARCDRLMDSAKRAGAVNTFWFERGELVGDNTDVAGFDAAARELLQGEPAGLTIGLIGAGGFRDLAPADQGSAGGRFCVDDRRRILYLDSFFRLGDGEREM